MASKDAGGPLPRERAWWIDAAHCCDSAVHFFGEAFFLVAFFFVLFLAFFTAFGLVAFLLAFFAAFGMISSEGVWFFPNALDRCFRRKMSTRGTLAAHLLQSSDSPNAEDSGTSETSELCKK